MSKRLPTLHLLICLLLVSIWANAQEPYQPTKVIPPSPTAASIGQYGNYDIGYYTGTPGIEIPLYDISTVNHKVPIKLNYNAIGVRVSQNASWVGLGWSLSAGGVITRTVVGLDDFGNNGYYIAEPLPVETSPMPAVTKQYFDEMLLGRKDTDPDIFSYNFMNYSGRFVMGKQSNGSTIFKDNQNNLKVEYVLGKWIITDGNGYKYYFGQTEVAYDYNYSSSTTEILDDAPLSSFHASLNPASVTAWYIDSVVAPSREKVIFSYEVKSSSVSLINKNERQDNLLSLIPGCSNPTSVLASTYKSYTASRQVIPDVYLKQITFNNGSVLFNTTDREDIEYINTAKPQKLSEVIVKRSDGGIVKKYSFYYNYFNGNANPQGRLKLDSLKELGNNVSKPPHVFSYYLSNNLPPKYTKSIDHWGFYNKKNNTSILPSAMAVDQISGDLRYFAGGDRRPDDDENTIKPGVISSITYPTGGYTDFDFELNEYSNLAGEDQYNSVYTGESVLARPGDEMSSARKSFDLTDTTLVTFLYNYTKAAEGPNLMEGLQVVYGYVYRQGVTAPVLSFDNWPNEVAADPAPETAGMALPPGHYTIQVTYIQSYLTEIVARWYAKVPVTQRKGGGLRIRSITSFEDQKKAGSRKFYYTDNNKTTGLAISPPKYDYYSIVGDNPLQGGCMPHIGYYLGRMSSTVKSEALTSSGTIIGYSKVTEVFEDSLKGGRNEYYYINEPDRTLTGGYPSVPAYLDPLNGKLVVMATYDSQGTLIRKMDYEYSTSQISSLRGVKVFQPMPLSGTAPSSYPIKYYDIYSNWSVLNGEVETLYQNDTITSRKRYYYENNSHKELTRKVTYKSDGRVITEKFIRPSDYSTAGANSFAGAMKLKNMLSPVIEQQTLVQIGNVNKLTAGTLVEYKLINNDFFKPGTIYKLNAAMPLADTTVSTINAANQLLRHANYKAENYFDLYSAKGNILSLHKANDQFVSYLWDHNESLLVAELTGAYVDQIAYTSFETGANGNLYIGQPQNILTGDGVTGNKCYPINGVLARYSLDPAKAYIVSLWTKNGIPDYNGFNGATQTIPSSNNWTTGISLNGWTYREKLLNGVTSINIGSGGGLVDEVRIYPSAAQMTTYTYDPLIGITSQCDINNRTTYYEYDGLARLRRIRNENKYILKQFDYQFLVPFHGDPIWQVTGATRCKPCPDNGSYITNISQNEEIDSNPNSTTNNQNRWTDAGASSNCVIMPNWANTTTPVRCRIVAAQNTGEQEQEQKDLNNCSPTYNQTKWVVVDTNTTACPLPQVTCNTSNCSGNDKKCVRGVCETGRVMVESAVWKKVVYNGAQVFKWECITKYCFTDGTKSTYSWISYQDTAPHIGCSGPI